MTSTSVSENRDFIMDIDDGDDKIEKAPKTDKKRKTRLRAAVWDHFIIYTPNPNQPDKKRVYCMYCKEKPGYVYAPSTNGTTSITNHYKSCNLNPENVKRLKSANIESFCHSSGVGVDGKSGQYSLGAKLKFDQQAIQNSLIDMVVEDELPFRFVEHPGFNKLMKVACPLFQMPYRFTVAKGCMALFEREKENLKSYLKKAKQRISITTDGWTSNQNRCYLVVTAHFVDDDWVLRKVIISFVTCASHKGDDVGLVIEECLKGWGLDNVFTVTVDNAASNDKTVAYLRRKFVHKGTEFVGGKYMHVRCVAHIINLIVRSGLEKHDMSIARVRNVVKYILHSPARELKLKECAVKEKIDTKQFLVLDCPTRWNSICDLLQRAVLYKSAFERYRDEDASVRVDFPNDESAKAYPNDSDWGVAEFMAGILEHFRAATVRVSGVSYVTANIFLDEVGTICNFVNSWIEGGDSRLRELAKNMKEKFDKYWGVESEKTNLICYVASLLDPRYKFFVVCRMLRKMFGEEYGNEVANSAMAVLKEFFEEYQKNDPPISKSSDVTTSGSIDSAMNIAPSRTLLKPNMSFFQEIIEEAGTTEVESELERYLNSPRVKMTDYTDFYILYWWRDHKNDYPILSRVARDIFAIPISTVASESTFSTGGRVINDFRSSLNPKTAEALICAQDWIRRARVLTYEEEIDIVQQIEEVLRITNGDAESTAEKAGMFM